MKESRQKDESFATQLERVTRNAAAFKRDRPQLQREELTREKAAAALDETAFKTQLKERLTLFLAETKAMPWTAALVEKDGRKLFADAEPGDEAQVVEALLPRGPRGDGRGARGGDDLAGRAERATLARAVVRREVITGSSARPSCLLQRAGGGLAGKGAGSSGGTSRAAV